MSFPHALCKLRIGHYKNSSRRCLHRNPIFALSAAVTTLRSSYIESGFGLSPAPGIQKKADAVVPVFRADVGWRFEDEGLRIGDVGCIVAPKNHTSHWKQSWPYLLYVCAKHLHVQIRCIMLTFLPRPCTTLQSLKYMGSFLWRTST